LTDYTKPKEKQTIVLGKNKTKVSMFSAKKDIHKEHILGNVKRILAETKADRVGQAYTKADYDKCYSAPRFVLADPTAPASLADLAYRVIVVSTEAVDENEDAILEASNRGANYRAKGASASDVETHKKDVQGGKDWVAARPAHHQNIVDHYNQATHAEKEFGHNWYDDAHHLTKAVARYTNTGMHEAAGHVANYSPQTDWAQNIHTASRVMRTKEALGGKGSGVFASGKQKEAATRMLNGESHENILKGHKIRAFAHLIEHGGNADPDKPHVVIDRHAAAVAHGDRITDNAYKHGLGGLKSKNLYHSYEQHYHAAAHAINAAHANDPNHKPVQAHQVQAVTWLVRQRKNQESEAGTSKKGASKTAKRTEKSAAAWDTERKTRFPNIDHDIRKMSGYSNKE
jgi:hypothetical protein